MSSPPKPWESSTTPLTSSPAPAQATVPTSSTVSPSTPGMSSSAPPAIPPRPAALSGAPVATTSTPYNNLSPYNPYSRLSTSYSPYGGGMYGGGPGYGGMGPYGGYGYGMNGMYGGMPGVGGMGMYPGMDPHNASLTQTLETTTQQTFTLLHSIVQTFSGVAQMLESTFMATHSSFFAMVGVVEQFSHLRNALGSVLGLFGLIRWLKDLIAGKASTPTNSLQGEFREFINGKPVHGPTGPPAPKPSKKPLIIFLLAIFGVPYAMSRLVKLLNERAQRQPAAQLGPIDPSSLPFARALYPFAPSTASELALKENEIVAVTGKLDPHTGMETDPRLDVETDWWRGRTRDGREGWFPRQWVEVLERRKPVDAPKNVD